MNFDLKLNIKYIDIIKKILNEEKKILLNIKKEGLFIIDNINNYSNILIFVENKFFDIYNCDENTNFTILLNNIYSLNNINSFKKKKFSYLLNNYYLPDNILEYTFNNLHLKYDDIINNNKFNILKNCKFKIIFSDNYDSILAKTYFDDLIILINILL